MFEANPVGLIYEIGAVLDSPYVSFTKQPFVVDGDGTDDRIVRVDSPEFYTVNVTSRLA